MKKLKVTMFWVSTHYIEVHDGFDGGIDELEDGETKDIMPHDSEPYSWIVEEVE